MLTVALFPSAAVPPQEQGAMTPSTPEELYTVLWTPPHNPKRLTNLFWSHVPKTSTTFSRTFFSYACGAESDDYATLQTTQPPMPSKGSCTAALSAEQDDLVNRTQGYAAVTWYHQEVPWTKGNTPQTSVRAVTLLREPAARMHSEYRHLASPEGYICCGSREKSTMPGQHWGWDDEARRIAIATAHGKTIEGEWWLPVDGMHDWMKPSNVRLSKYRDVLQTRASLYGCQTKMLIGVGCHESHNLTATDVERARKYVRSPNLAFVGLMERYMESVCLFHAQHGGPLYSFEVFLERPAEETSIHVLESAHASGLVNDYIFGKIQDEFRAAPRDDTTVNDFKVSSSVDPDVEIYELARQRFEAGLAEHRQHVDECMRSVAKAKTR